MLFSIIIIAILLLFAVVLLTMTHPRIRGARDFLLFFLCVVYACVCAFWLPAQPYRVVGHSKVDRKKEKTNWHNMRATATVIHEKRLSTVASIGHETNFKYKLILSYATTLHIHIRINTMSVPSMQMFISINILFSLFLLLIFSSFGRDTDRRTRYVLFYCTVNYHVRSNEK